MIACKVFDGVIDPLVFFEELPLLEAELNLLD